MDNLFKEFKKQYPNVAKTMDLLGMTYEQYLEAWRWIYDPPRISMSNTTTLLPLSEQIWYTNSTNPQKES